MLVYESDEKEDVICLMQGRSQVRRSFTQSAALALAQASVVTATNIASDDAESESMLGRLLMLIFNWILLAGVAFNMLVMVRFCISVSDCASMRRLWNRAVSKFVMIRGRVDVSESRTESTNSRHSAVEQTGVVTSLPVALSFNFKPSSSSTLEVPQHVVVTKSGQCFHSASCQTVKDKDVVVYRPCKVCLPGRSHSTVSVCDELGDSEVIRSVGH